MKKGNNSQSIGFFFGLFEESKEEYYYVTEYSIQQTYLEKIFNKFADNQGKTNNELEDINIIDENDENKIIVIDDDLFNNILI